MTAPVKELPPQGRYLAHEVGRLAGVSGDRIGQWARRGYICSSVSSSPPRIYSYQDVAEAMVVHELVLSNVSLDAIKSTIATLREQFGTSWPLSHTDLYVPRRHPKAKGKGQTVVVTEANAKVEPTSGAAVLDGVDLVAIRTDLSCGGWAARNLPDLTHIEVDPDRLSGRPAIRGRRIAAEDVAEIAAAPGGYRLLRDDYGLSQPEIIDARRWWDAVRQFESAA